MARLLFIVQGEGRGHLSQSIALKEILEDAGNSVESVYVGQKSGDALPDYFLDAFDGKLNYFHSPYLLRTPNRKGIYIGKTLLFNLFRSLTYVKEVRRLRREINMAKPDLVINFYDLVGALALRATAREIRRIGIGHHFFLHLDGYRCNGGSGFHRWLLKIHTKRIINACDRVLALSFKPGEGDSEIAVVPPLIRRKFREVVYRPGDRYLAYFLHEGFIFDLITLSRKDPEFASDVFTGLIPGIELPDQLSLFPVEEERFCEKMASCKGLITTAGFDTVAEAAYLGIPLLAVPAKNHFEQKCNSLDMERAGIGIWSHRIGSEQVSEMKTFNNSEYRKWVESAGEQINKILVE